jgi:hypothetical protein
MWLPLKEYQKETLERLADLLRTKTADHGRRQMRRATDWLMENRPDKKAVGQLWAGRSNGACRFAWVVDKDWQTLAAVGDG